MTNKYQNGKIYTIRCKTDNNLIFVGCTIQSLAKRWGGHKVDSSKNPNIILYQKINNNWNNWYIELYELYPCNSKEELYKRKGEITRLIGNLNMVIADRTEEEYNKHYYKENAEKRKEDFRKYYKENTEKLKQKYIENIEKKKEYDKHYYNENAEKRKEDFRKNYIDNIEKRKEYKRKYRTENAEKIKQYQQEYREKNKKMTEI